jgi:hypothetical protein
LASATLVAGMAWLVASLSPYAPRAPGPTVALQRPEAGAPEVRAEFAARLTLPAPQVEAAKPQPSPGARVDALANSADPHDAYRAFRLIDGCVRARAAEGRQDIKSACRDIGPAQLRLRLPLLEAAARAGVPGAVTAWTGEGPFGDKTALSQRPDDPLVIEWVHQAVAMIRAAAGRDDVAAITQLGWLTVHWNLSDIERLSALVNRPAEWAPQLPAQAEHCEEPTPCR